MTTQATRLCVSCILVFTSFLALLCSAFALLIGRNEIMPRPPGKRRFPVSLFDLMLSLLFILAVSGLSLMLNRLPRYLSIF